MNRALIIAAQEWRYWRRSNLVLCVTALFALLLIATTVITALRMDAQRHDRLHHQTQAEEAFLSQPDRHPHRMVHYGHYVFRTPAPLAVLDPGLDPVTGQSIFLEGHRQNSAMFADAAASADLGSLAWLTPALVYQVFAPLLIILLGHSAIVREREAATLAPLLAQGVSGTTLLGGKALALLSVVAVLLLPMLPGIVMALNANESLAAGLSLAAIYLVYFMVWSALTLLASLLLSKRSQVLALLCTGWLILTLLLPAIAVNVASQQLPLAGKIETDLRMQSDLNKLSDGHNANDPGFDQLRNDLLKQYRVEKVEDLPINLRGIVAMTAEEKLTRTLNKYAERRMAVEIEQSALFAQFGWFSPTLALTVASRAIVGSDLKTHHRFLQEAEQLRFNFVQSLNRVHAEQLNYRDDINRSSNAGAERRTRVSADNWRVLEDFHFEPTAVTGRLAQSAASAAMLILWLVGLALSCVYVSRRMQP